MKNLWKEFKEFAFAGSVLDMAIGVILGGAMKEVVDQLVGSVLLPLISGIVHMPADLAKMSAEINGIEIVYGAFLSALINFLLLALCVFLMVKAINKAKSVIPAEEEEEEEEEEEPSAEAQLLTEIRDLLKAQAGTSEEE